MVNLRVEVSEDFSFVQIVRDESREVVKDFTVSLSETMYRLHTEAIGTGTFNKQTGKKRAAVGEIFVTDTGRTARSIRSYFEGDTGVVVADTPYAGYVDEFRPLSIPSITETFRNL
jgi:phage gpG-like protein